MSAPNRSRLVVRLGLVLVVIVAAVWFAANRLRQDAFVAVIHRGVAPDVVTASVVVHADKDLQEIKNELPGRVLWIDPRQLGEAFKKGEPILKLDASELERSKKEAYNDFQAQLERTKIQKQNDPALQVAKEALANAELQYNRKTISEVEWRNAQRLYKQTETNLALAEFDTKQAQTRFEDAQAALQRQIDKMTIVAPMDGVVQAIMVAPGALIGAGTTVATYFSNERVVIAKVGEEDVGKVSVGQPARVHLLNLPNETFDAKVTTILPFADQDTQRYGVYLQVDADSTKLKPFSTGEATITVGRHDNQPLIPRRALFNDDFVLVVHNGKVEKRKVKTGFKSLNLVEALGNLQEGEQVIVEDMDLYRDGQHVRPVVVE
jgi:RND family efflux transporter MFP subunit